MTNQKSKNIAYWVVTGLLCFGMILGGSGQLFMMKPNLEGFAHIGFPTYVLPLFGTWKFLAVIAILVPKYTLVKEWAYAGLFFLLSGGVVAHLASGDDFLQTLPVFVFMCLTMASWYLRPANRRLVLTKQ
jgi:hypothetical protein